MTLMAGPIDTRIAPTKVNELASDKPIAWFEQQPDRPRALALQGRAPARLSGLHPAFRVHGDEPDRHVKAHVDLFHNLAGGDVEKANQTKSFYDEYFAVLDLPAEFYLETVQWVFQEHRLPQGTMK